MDAACTIQDSIHVFSLVSKGIARTIGTEQNRNILHGIFTIAGHL